MGWVLAICNASGFIASLLLPAYADKKHDYLGPMLLCAALTLLLAVVLAVVTSLPAATIALVVIGGPAGVVIIAIASRTNKQIRHHRLPATT